MLLWVWTRGAKETSLLGRAWIPPEKCAILGRNLHVHRKISGLGEYY